MIELGGFIIVGFIFMVWMVISAIRTDNETMKEMRKEIKKRKLQQKWNWD